MDRFSAAKKNRDNMLLFLSGTEVEQAVKNIRRNFGIPAKGFKGGEECTKWMAKMATDYAKIRDLEERELSAFIRFMRALHVLGKGLPEHFARHLKDYILYDTTNSPLHNFEIAPMDVIEEDPNRRVLNIKIYAELTDAEWTELRKMTKLMGHHLPKYRPLKNIEQKITHEKDARGVRERNQESGREYHATYGEVVGKNVAKQARENLRELADLRKKRFGKK